MDRTLSCGSAYRQEETAVSSNVLAPAPIALWARDDVERPSDSRVERDARIVSPQGSERRAHRRLSSQELKWLREARMQYGPAVRLVDVSAGGALFEAPVRVSPNTDVDLHLVGRDLDTVMRSRVLRSHVVAIGDALWYRTACAFRRSFDVSVLLALPPQRNDFPTVDYLKAEFALKSIVDQYAHGETGDNGLQSADAAAMFDALRMVQRSAQRCADPGDRQLAGLVARALRGLEGAESIGAAMASIEGHLRLAMPLVAIRLTAAPAAPAAGVESIYFDITANGLASACVLNVEFASGFAPDIQQFRLLKSCAHLITLLRGFHVRSSGSCPAVRVATERGEAAS
jgi:hypothetical protein